MDNVHANVSNIGVMNRPKRAVLGTIALVLGLIAVGWGGYRYAQSRGMPDGLLQANGRIEGDHITIASKFPGRVIELRHREGDTIKAGELLIQIDDAQTKAKVEQARRAVESLAAQVESAHTGLAVLNLEVPLAIEAAAARVASAQAAIGKAKAVAEETRRDVVRIRPLTAQQAASQQQLDQAEAAWSVATHELAAARAALVQAMKEDAQAQLGWQRIKAKEAEVAGLERQRDQAEAALTEMQSVLDDLTITAPTTGTITTRMVDIGEVVAPGTPLLEVVDLDRLYLKVYVPEVQIGKMRLGLPARIFTDAYPDAPVDATVRYIASQAEFTPKEVQTPDERVKLVYAAKLYLNDNPDHRLTPGLPADAVIRWKDDVAWVRPKW
jgi:HlyD family secretion protein